MVRIIQLLVPVVQGSWDKAKRFLAANDYQGALCCQFAMSCAQAKASGYDFLLRDSCWERP